VLGSSLIGMKNLQFDPKFGFLLKTVTTFSSGIYQCFAKFNGIENFVLCQLDISRKEIWNVFEFHDLNLLYCFWLQSNHYLLLGCFVHGNIRYC